jgi:hypothetical protein
MLPRKGKSIDIGDSSLVDLQAAVYRCQQRRRGQQPALPPVAARRGPRLRDDDIFATRNRGVDARDSRVMDSETREQERAESALERKAEQYAQMMRGEPVGGSGDVLADGGDSLVDWDRKQLSRGEESGAATLVSDDMRRDAQRQRWERDAAAEAGGGSAPSAGGGERNSSLKRYLSEVVEETTAEREHAVAERAKRERDKQSKSDLVAAKRAALRGAGARTS